MSWFTFGDVVKWQATVMPTGEQVRSGIVSPWYRTRADAFAWVERTEAELAKPEWKVEMVVTAAL